MLQTSEICFDLYIGRPDYEYFVICHGRNRYLDEDFVIRPQLQSSVLTWRTGGGELQSSVLTWRTGERTPKFSVDVEDRGRELQSSVLTWRTGGRTPKFSVDVEDRGENSKVQC